MTQPAERLDRCGTVDQGDNIGKLVVFVPDSTGRVEPLEPLIEVLCNQPTLRGAHLLKVPYMLSWWSNHDLWAIARNISAKVENYYLEHQHEISGIILCGFSLGATLVRRAYLDANGYGLPRGNTQRWAQGVERIVLMGAICRGFKMSRLPAYHRLALRTAWMLGLGKALRSAFWGEPFVSNVRTDWITLRQSGGANRPLVVNVLGANDQLVAREDAIDLEQDPDAAHVDIPGATHDTVIFPTPQNRVLLADAFVGKPSPSPPPIPQRYKRAAKVYMLIHGMRSSKHFVMKLAENLRKREPDSLVLTPDYGYIPIMSFLSRAYRRSKAAKFVDDYTQCLAVNPNARFYFAGHSNGTCILGEALRQVSRIRFFRLYFAGSALPTSYDWTTVIEARDQVAEFVRSDRGSKDWAVGILGRTLEKLSPWVPSFQGVGSGGYDGFNYGNQNRLNEPCFSGGHSEMFKEDKLASIVEFLTAKDRSVLPQKNLPAPMWFTLLHKHGSILIPPVAVLYIALVGLLLLSYVINVPYLPAGLGLPLGVSMAVVAGFLLYRF